MRAVRPIPSRRGCALPPTVPRAASTHAASCAILQRGAHGVRAAAPAHADLGSHTTVIGTCASVFVFFGVMLSRMDTKKSHRDRMDDASEAASDAPPASEVSGSLFGGSVPPQPNPQVQDAATVRVRPPLRQLPPPQVVGPHPPRAPVA